MRSEDIAKLAGVSRSTVSRVINQYPNVPEETRRKVMKVIEEHHYEPNTNARVLAGKGTDTIGLFVISTAEQTRSNRIYQNSYFAPFVDALVDTANALGYYVLIHTVYSEEDFQKIRQAFSQKRIDGGVIVGTQKNLEEIRSIAQLGEPLVLIDYDPAELALHHMDSNTVSVINSKDYAGSCEAVRHLIGLGHRDIAFISGRLNTHSGRERFRAYENTLKEHGIPYREELVIDGDFRRKPSYEAISAFLASGARPSAFFAANDEMALGALDAFREFGLRVPEDVSLIGFDDSQIASRLTPALTSVRVPIADMSRTAAETIVTMCRKPNSAFSAVSFPTELVVRESCSDAPNGR
ncbi:LacI family DNA-binding transcriptional regulator [Gorillibacterium timonense]|uniref:LacI family DNA-binding transcriptional regulator n=1 Tax=Gorillibacterium timonense TaxID=1689269 RepID=UPI00071C5901|nr:LacI family DNA-binding transcriptional regulator [Gorillibacterium timonense]